MDHLTDPQSVVPESVIPKNSFMLNRPITGEYVGELLETHRFFGESDINEMIEVALADFEAQADPDSDFEELLERYPKAIVSNFDGQNGITEMDALIA